MLQRICGQLVIDAVSGNGGMFSPKNGAGKRFMTRSRLFTDGESATLELQGQT